MRMLVCLSLIAISVSTVNIEPAAAAELNARGTEARSSERIWNGEPVDAGDAPWAVSLREDGQHICGGSLISPVHDSTNFEVSDWRSNDNKAKFVVTAAHCVFDGGDLVPANKLTVFSGSRIIGDKGEVQKVLKIYRHPEYDPVTLVNDIAVLRISDAVKDINKLDRNSIRLPTSIEDLWVGEPYLATQVVGWGRTETGFASSKLLGVRVPKVDHDYCQDKFSVYGDVIERSMFCAGYSSGEYDSCQGDSGGSIFYSKADGSNGPGYSSTPVLLGVVSWGRGCANPNLFGVYTDIRSFKKWIGDVVGESLKQI